ncbi:MAG TPA: acetyl-CoA hydrolase/transferase C-terminal domain-containing protein [Candidatus Binatia bacterium]|jgi:acyl-CoA hydrolase|nr:acetyl-CoA hydrolase/transferase C-terminal domain-containing protein [Candidatus Binatia bacterium]
MPWIDDYRRKLLSAPEAVRLIHSGDRVFTSGNAATPRPLLRALIERKNELEAVELVHLLLMGNEFSAPGLEGHFRHNALFVGPGDRQAVNAGQADYTPIFLSEIPTLFSSGVLPLDVAILQVSPPDEHGFMSLGIEVLASKAAAAAARTVIVQVNRQMPRVLGDSFLHVSRVQAVVESDEPLPELESGEFGKVEKALGQHIADLIPDGATLQMGIGTIPDAVLASLTGKRDLGVHTEMISDGVMQAMEAGIFTGARKTLHPGKALATLILGSRALYRFVDNNPAFELHPSTYTNDPFIIAQHDNLIAINSALEIDLTGQVCADSIGTAIYSGFGGQLDFMRGAARSRGGKPIIALPATARDGEMSRIVPVLRPGAGVVTTRGDVHYVVSEFGVAQLYGKPLRQRAHALIGIAHPKFREPLERAARERKLL